MSQQSDQFKKDLKANEDASDALDKELNAPSKLDVDKILASSGVTSSEPKVDVILPITTPITDSTHENNSLSTGDNNGSSKDATASFGATSLIPVFESSPRTTAILDNIGDSFTPMNKSNEISTRVYDILKTKMDSQQLFHAMNELDDILSEYNVYSKE